MEKLKIRKTKEGLEIPIRGKLITGIEVDFEAEFHIWIGELGFREYAIRSGECEISDGSQKHLISTTQEKNAPFIMRILGEEIEKCFIYNSGKLTVEFTSGLKVCFYPEDVEEAWRFDSGRYGSFSAGSLDGTSKPNFGYRL